MRHTVLLRSDGGAVGCGDSEYGQCGLPAPVTDFSYAQGVAGAHLAAVLRSAGGAVGCDDNEFGQCNLPGPIAGLSFAQLPPERDARACSGHWRRREQRRQRDRSADLPGPTASLSYAQVPPERGT